jgi:hypothetical protein
MVVSASSVVIQLGEGADAYVRVPVPHCLNASQHLQS